MGVTTGQTHLVASLQLTDLTVVRDGRILLDAVNLDVPHGERVAILGSSGAGKTTLLRGIIGMEPLDRGRVMFDGEDVTTMPVSERGAVLLAQSARLLPHLDVAGNIGFPLELQHVPRTELDRRVRAQARAFSIGGLLGRRSSVLSAGQIAEVALARSFVRDPTVVLMDEPFTRIDTPGRASHIRELLRVQREGDITLLVATNDQRVAGMIARTIVVLEAGRVVQVGGPRELREEPASTYVAGLFGEGPLNLLPAQLVREHGQLALRIGPLSIPTWQLSLTDHGPGPVQVAARPTDLMIGYDVSVPQLRGQVVRHAFLGDAIDVTVSTQDAQLTVRCSRPAPGIGARVQVAFPPDRLHVFDPAGWAIAHGV